ncbi:MAG: hypothetical protein Q8J82_08005 [Methylotenera sp.]|uniref:hypothetical protein n=1 Tax=Methylotenera sp. TaxID=2051956 RepID=UPI00272F536D|nr:hypothetical protein [Methylotenera sp.]MDP2071559.1 hypothetical protein [Methylotenera sp.]
MANATPQKRFNVSFTRSQLELLEKMLEQEIFALESGYAHPHPQLLKRTFDAVYEHLQPSADEKQKRFENWVKKIQRGRSRFASAGVCAHAELSGAA